MLRQQPTCHRPSNRRTAPWILILLIALVPVLVSCGRDEPPTPTPVSVNPGPQATPELTDEPEPQGFERRPVDLVIMHTNDVAGEIDPCG